MGGGDLLVIIAQMVIILIFVLVITRFLKFRKSYEEETLSLINQAGDDIDDLLLLRSKRKTYKSKANITRRILAKQYSIREVEKLRKYATTPKDMEHYYSAKIDALSKEERQTMKEKRDSYLKRYGKKGQVFPDFEENLKTSGKWILFFFIIAGAYNLLPRLIKMQDIILASYMLLGMIFLAVIMINTILWIIRTLKAYWIKDLM